MSYQDENAAAEKTASELLSLLSPEEILQVIPSGVFLVDRNQRIIQWNAEAERITGYSAAEAMGQHCSFLAGIPCGEGCGLYNDKISKPVIGASCTVRTRDGHRIILLKNIDYLRGGNGEIVGGIEAFTEVTPLVRMEERLRRQTSGLQSMVRRRTRELEKERNHLRTVLDAMSDFAYIAGPDCRVIYMNRPMIEAMGAHEGERCHQVFYGLETACPWCPMEEVGQGRTVREERPFVISGRVYEVIHTPLRTGGAKVQKLAVFRDITDRKRLEEDLLRTKKRLEFLLGANTAVFFSTIPEPDFTATFVSDNVRDLTGYDPREFLVEGFWLDKVNLEDRQQIKEAMQSTGDRKIFEYRFRTREGTWRWMRNEVRFIRDPNGTPLELVGCMIDITDRREAEARLRESNRELDAFVYTVSHDLRSPLTPIIGYADLLTELCRDKLDPQELEMLQEIENQGRKALALIEDLLALARVGRVERPAEPVDLNRIVAETLEELGPNLRESGVQVEVSELPPLLIPETLLGEVFANLLGNAIRYAGGPGARLEIESRQASDRICLLIRDHGPGIPPAERERIFELFYRGAAAGKTRGTGIGLAIVRKVVRLYEGSVLVEETPGGGSTFRLEFPRSAGTPPERPRSAA